MTSKSGFLVLILLASGCCKACGEGQIGASPRSSEAAPTPDQPNVDEPTPDQSDVAGKALEPENTQGDSWETIYENCTGDDYPSGYRPPLFVRPTMQNTGANCPDKASGCPADATLVERTSHIDSPGVYENFYKDGLLRINASNVTLRNFEINCSGGASGVQLSLDYSNIVIEYGTIQKGTAPCKDGIWVNAPGLRVKNVHIDQHESDGFNGSQHTGPVMIERSLVTRGGDNGGYGSSNHADVWQHWNTSGTACWLGSRVVPSYCPNFYKTSNVTQSSIDPPGKMYIYNGWLDGSTNVMIAGDGRIVRNNKFGNFTSTGRYWFDGSVTDMGGNVFECNGQALSSGQALSPQLTCPWGFDNDPVIGWDGENETGDGRPADGNNNPILCSGTVDSQPIDPTEFCTSDGSGCVVTR